MSNPVDFHFIDDGEHVLRHIGCDNYNQMVLAAKETSHHVQLHGNDDESAALRYEKPGPVWGSKKKSKMKNKKNKKKNRGSVSYRPKPHDDGIPVDLTDKHKGCGSSWCPDLVASIEEFVKSETPFLLHIDGYFKENQKAGYSVIIWDPLKRPIVAYSWHNKYQYSAFYHELRGVNKGLELAIELKLVCVSMHCTSDKVAMFVRSHCYKTCNCHGGSPVDVCLKCFKKRYHGTYNDKTYLLGLDTVGLLQAFYRQKGKPFFIIEAVEASNKKSAAYVAEHWNGKGKIKRGEIFENKELLSLLLIDEANIQRASMASSVDGNPSDSNFNHDGEHESYHLGCDNGANGNQVLTACDQMVSEKKETSHHVPKEILSSIDLRVDLSAEVKKFVKSWFKSSNGVSMDDVVQAWIQSVKIEDKVLVHVGGYFKENQKARYGVMIRDVHNRPITAYSGYNEDIDSAFYHELQGVNKALELVIELKLGYVFMCCTSAEVSMFVGRYWCCTHIFCHCGSDSCVDVCLRCLKNHFYLERGKDDKTYLLLLDTIGLLQAFHRQDNDNVIHIDAVKADNKSAAYIAEHGNGKGKMKLIEILEDGKLLSLLFEEASIELARQYARELARQYVRDR